jgi:hypothetical protein
MGLDPLVSSDEHVVCDNGSFILSEETSVTQQKKERFVAVTLRSNQSVIRWEADKAVQGGRMKFS